MTLRVRRHRVYINDKLWKLAALCASLVACGGEAKSSSLDPKAQASTLSGNEAADFCDWEAGLFGGYGKAVSCNGAELDGPQDQTTCVSNYVQGESKWASCPATVAQVQACMQWETLGACTSPPATPPDACTVVSTPECSSG